MSVAFTAVPIHLAEVIVCFGRLAPEAQPSNKSMGSA